MELIEENKDIAKVFMLTRRQYITAGMGTPIDISIPAIVSVMDIYGVADRIRCLEAVRSLFYKTLPEPKQ